MNTERRWKFLLVAAKRVSQAFRDGRNPTFDQIQKLESAIESIDTLKICGHRLIDECDCAEQVIEEPYPERGRQNTRLVYNKETKKIDMMRGNKGLVVGSFDPPEEI